MKNIYIGTSGYNYKHWLDDVFYPPGHPKNKLLEYYAQHFNTVELNSPFYGLPTPKTVKNWHRRTPENFKFVVKGSRYTTHLKRLKDPAKSTKLFFDNIKLLKEKLACVLWQLPPSMKFNHERILSFVKTLSKNPTAKKVLHSIEFRHPSWFTDETYKILTDHNVNLCIANSPNWPCSEKITSDFIYLRFHGDKNLYSSNYSNKELKKWAGKIKRWIKEEKFAFCFFNNDEKGFAVKNAKELERMLRQ